MISVCILGGSGNIGKALHRFLKRDPEIQISSLSISDYLTSHHNFDVIYYCIGMTSDFQKLPFRTVEAHIEHLSKVLKTKRFGTLVYLSSTRIYKNSFDTREETQLSINPIEGDSIYNISKLVGESLCLLTQKERARIVRISNVVGGTLNDNSFLGFLGNSLMTGVFELNSSLKSEKDFVDIERVTYCLKAVGLNSKHRVYNIGSGFNLRTEEIIDAIASQYSYPFKVHSNENVIHSFPTLDISKISSEFGVKHYQKADIIQIILASMNGFLHEN